MIHEHGWCFLGDFFVPRNTELHRVEFCLSCGTVRVEFSGRWWVMVPEWSRDRLNQVTVFKNRPAKGISPKTPPSRLGRGLKELLDQNKEAPVIRGLFPIIGEKHAKKDKE